MTRIFPRIKRHFECTETQTADVIAFGKLHMLSKLDDEVIKIIVEEQLDNKVKQA